MKRIILAAAIAAVFSMPLGAQSLEQSYASLCGESSKDSETCRTLRQALMDKLAQDGASAGPAKAAAATVKPGKVGPQWRVWAPLAGKTLVDENGDIHRFEWVEKGAVLQSMRQTARGEDVTRYELKTDGTVMVLRDGRPPVAMEPSGKTSFVVVTPGAEGERWRYSPAAGGIEIVQESLSEGKWAATGKRSSRTLATGTALAAAEAKLAEARDAAISAEWKALGRMAGRDYLWRAQSGTGEDSLLTVRWEEFGKKISMRWDGIPSGRNKRTQTIVRDAATGQFTVDDSNKDAGTVTLDDTRLSIVWTTLKNGRGNAFSDFSPTGSGLASRLGRVKKGKRRDETDESYTDVTGIDRKKLDEAAGYALAQRKETARQQQQQQQAAKANSGGGMFGRMLGGALMGAMLGGGGQSSIDLAMAGAQAAAGGGNTYDMLTSMGGVAQANAEQSKRELDATIARAHAQAAEQRAAKRQEELAAAEAKATAASAAAEGRAASAASAAEAARLRDTAAREAAAAEAEAKRTQEAETRRLAAAADKARRDEAARLAEAERNRPVEWKEGIVLCEQRQGSTEWRCAGPLQVTYAKLDAPNTLAQIGMACGSSNGVRDIGTIGLWRGFGCGYGIHPTDRNYPGNTDVPAQRGVFVDNRRIFHCPKTKDAYCRNP